MVRAPRSRPRPGAASSWTLDRNARRMAGSPNMVGIGAADQSCQSRQTIRAQNPVRSHPAAGPASLESADRGSRPGTGRPSKTRRLVTRDDRGPRWSPPSRASRSIGSWPAADRRHCSISDAPALAPGLADHVLNRRSDRDAGHAPAGVHGRRIARRVLLHGDRAGVRINDESPGLRIIAGGRPPCRGEDCRKRYRPSCLPSSEFQTRSVPTHPGQVASQDLSV